MSNNSAFILQSKEDLKFLGSAKSVDTVLVLTAGLEKYIELPQKLHVIAIPYTNENHKNTAILLEKLLTSFHAKMLVNGASQIVADSVKGKLFYIISAASYIRESLENYTSYSWVSSGKLIEGDFDRAFESLFSKVLANKRYYGKAYQIGFTRRIIAKLYNHHISKKLEGKTKILIADGGRASSRNFVKAAKQIREDAFVLLAKETHKNFISTIRQIIRSLIAIKTGKFEGKHTPVFFFYSHRQKFASEIVTKTISEYNGFEKKVLDFAADYLRDLAADSAGFEKTVKTHLNQLSPSVVSMDAIASAFQMSVCKEAKAAGANVVFFNHGAVSYQQDGVSKLVTNLWASLGRVYSAYATHHVARAPSVFKIIAENIASIKNTKALQVRFDEKKLALAKTDKFRFLFAGNFLNPVTHVPWIMETPAEFMQGIFSLSEAISKIPEAELIIRIKPSKIGGADIDYELIKTELAKFNNVKFDTNPSFKQSLAESNILVAGITTTIDEALQAGVPVLLHTGGMRYHYLPAMTSMPTNANRSAVYATTKEVEVTEFLRAIILAHKDKALSEEETMPYSWGSDSLSLTQLAKQVLS